MTSSTNDQAEAPPTTPGRPSPERMGVIATWRQTPRQTRALLAGIFVSKLAGFIQIFLVLFLTARGFSTTQAGVALGLYGAGAVGGAFLGGALSDRQSARTATLVSMFGSALLLVSIVYLKPYPLLLLAILAVSAVGQIYRPAAQALIAESTPPGQLVMVTAIYRLGLNLGTSIAPLLGVALVSVSYNLLFWGEAIAAGTYCVIALCFLPRGRVAARRPAPAEDTSQDVAAKRAGYRQLLADRRYLLFLLGFLLMHLVYTQYTATLPLAVKAAGVSTWWYGAAISVNGAFIVAFEVWVTRFTQHWPLRLAQFFGYGLLAAGYAVYAIGVTPWCLMIGTLLWTISEVLGAPTIWSYPSRVAPAQLLGRYFGSLHSTASIGSTLGPILGILLYQEVHSAIFAWAAVVGVVATIVGSLGMQGSAARQTVDPAEAEPAL